MCFYLKYDGRSYNNLEQNQSIIKFENTKETLEKILAKLMLVRNKLVSLTKMLRIKTRHPRVKAQLSRK